MPQDWMYFKKPCMKVLLKSIEIFIYPNIALDYKREYLEFQMQENQFAGGCVDTYIQNFPQDFTCG